MPQQSGIKYHKTAQECIFCKVKAGERVSQHLFGVACIALSLPRMSSFATAGCCQQRIYPFVLSSPASARALLHVFLCVQPTPSKSLEFFVKRGLCLDRTFQPALIVLWDNATPPSLPNCKALTSLALAGWQAGLDLLPAWDERWAGSGQSPGWLRAVSWKQDTASFAAAGNWYSAGTEKINTSHLQRVHVSATHFLEQP